MARKPIPDNIKRKLWAESIGRCLNPDCQIELFNLDGDIAEQAHIVPYSETQDNSFENLIMLCPNCHTKFDKNRNFDINDVKSWKDKRKAEIEQYFSKRFKNFEELKKNIVPLLIENQDIYENYFLEEDKKLWEKFEGKILANNEKLKKMLEANLTLIQDNNNPDYSNRTIVRDFIAHVNEFEITRNEEEKNRKILFPKEINSIFGIEPIQDNLIQSTESLEDLIEKLKNKGEFYSLELGIERPYIALQKEGNIEKIYLKDTPRLRQLYYDNHSFKTQKVRLESLNFAMKYIRSRNIPFSYPNESKVREISVKKIKILFVYEYCLSKSFLEQTLPEEGSVIVNLHNWNGESCISSEAHGLAQKLNVTLLSMDSFYVFIKKFR